MVVQVQVLILAQQLGVKQDKIQYLVHSLLKAVAEVKRPLQLTLLMATAVQVAAVVVRLVLHKTKVVAQLSLLNQEIQAHMDLEAQVVMDSHQAVVLPAVAEVLEVQVEMVLVQQVVTAV
jgi:hypothetical protein